jgi:ABC-type lipoprotein export system ATPase subunit
VTAPGQQHTEDIVRLHGVQKIYGNQRTGVRALDGVSIGFRRGGFTAVMGPSGSGKSTFLHCAAGLDRPSAGSVVLDGQDLTALSERKLTELRRERIGFIFQAFNLLPALTVLENVSLPLRWPVANPSGPRYSTCCPGSASTVCCDAGPVNSPVASSSGWPSRWR